MPILFGGTTQQFLVKFPDGRMQVLPTCWDVEKREWYHLYPDEEIAPDDPLFGHDLCKIGTICVQIAIQRIYERKV